MGLTLVTRKQYKRTGLLGLGERPPTQVAGVLQRVVYDGPPTQCDKCQSRDIAADPVEPRRYTCFQCGSDWFIVETPWRRTWTPAR